MTDSSDNEMAERAAKPSKVLSKAYKGDASIEHYVRLRRENPGAEIEVSTVGGLETLIFMKAELKAFGFDPDLVAGVMDADPGCISELCLQLLEQMIEARRRAKLGDTHLSSRGVVVPDKLINWLVAVMLDSLSWNNDLHIPRDLIVLIRERTMGSNPDYKLELKVQRERQNAILIGGQLIARGESASLTRVAEILGIAPSTVHRWFPEKDFSQQAEAASHWFDEQGRPRVSSAGSHTQEND
jgi:hypothetical protein